MTDLENLLNEQQIKGVKTTEGGVLVIAGAGSGKTRVLTYRIAYLIDSLQVSPYNILAITFTNKAANEMKERLEKLCSRVNGLWVSTFHSFCARVLRSHIDRIGYGKDYSIYGDLESSRVVKRILQNKHLEEKNYLNTCLWHISNAKNQGLTPEKYASQCAGKNVDTIIDVYSAYEEELRQNNALDYDDLLLKTVQLFITCPDVLEYYADRFTYIHVDEYQDTNKIQYMLVKMLASIHGNVFAVGDEDQSIYGWRGADISNIFNFEKDFPNAQIIKLEQNYRSTANILNAGNALISYNTQRYGKTLWTKGEPGENVTIRKLGTDLDEAEFVVRTIASQIEAGANPSDFAVLVRLNALTNKIEERLTSYGVPYKVFGGMKFFERKEIKDVLAYLRVIVNPRDNEAMLRIINTPKRGIGDTVVSALLDVCASAEASICDVLFDNNLLHTLSPQIVKKLSAFIAVYRDIYQNSMAMTVTELTKYIIERAGFSLLYSGTDEDDYNRRMNLEELVNAVSEFEKTNQNSSISDFLQNVSLMTDTDDIQTEDFVTVATVHAVKGLEFNVVFIIGLEENIFPSGVYNKSEAEIEEERRVMYVAITRARKKLYMTSVWERFRFGKREQNKESRFLGEIKTKLLGSNAIPQPKPTRAIPRTTPSQSTYNRDNQQNTYNAPKYQVQYTATEKKEPVKIRMGQKVKHRKFGVGTVINVKGTVAQIAFEGVGIKNLDITIAPLEPIGE